MLAPAVPGIVEQIIDTVPDQIPAYAVARDGRYGEALSRGVEGAIMQLLSLPGTAKPALNEESRRRVASLGAGEFRQRRSMEALLAAYRTSARITFRGLSEACVAQGMEMPVVVNLGESILAYIDELSAVSAQAYAFEQSARAGALELRRTDLIGALLRGGTSHLELHRLAAAADWQLPARMAAVVLPLEWAGTVRTRLGTSGLVVELDSEATAVVAAPQVPRLRARLAAVFAGTAAVVGPAADWDSVAHSHRVARLVAAQRATDLEAGDGPAVGGPGPDNGGTAPLFASDYLSRAILGAEPEVMEELVALRLAPLDKLSEAKRPGMEQTLLSWLVHWGQRAPVARELGVHPQTVGYRLGRLRELFGDQLDDPDVRFDLELALRSRLQ